MFNRKTKTEQNFTRLYRLVENIDSLLFWKDVLLLKITSTVDVAHPVTTSRVCRVDVEQKFLGFHVNNLSIP